MKRIPVRVVTGLLMLGATLAPSVGLAAASTTPTTKLYTCGNSTVARPAAFVISCADGNASLTKTHWSTWTAQRASGTTTFALNLCNPNCAASKISNFSGSTVTLSAPEVTKKHGRLFSELVVTYKLKGVKKTFKQSWQGDPAFAH